MKRHEKFSVMLLACFSLSLLNAGVISTVNAAQEDAKEVQQTPGKIQGKVTEVIDVSGYTYAEVDTGTEKVWAAGPPTPLKKGDMVAFSSQMPMQNFHSKTLGRDFSTIYFISDFVTDSKESTQASAHTQLKQKMSEPVKGIEKVEGGNTIAEIYSNKNNLKGKTVRVRGKVSKYTPNIMGKNWVHISDSSTIDDLTVTTTDTTAVGDVVICQGKLELDKDYSYGYIYPVIMEGATVTKE
ncbi:MAG: DNA-binding protein [Gammaproteobacteria bacterium]|jgi:hypothetical protein|nr:DNA-binding protein [Gammaproteobacteria bacterium]